MHKLKPAFTLIELLVVIAIAATLLSITFVAYSNTKEKSLDKKRKDEIKAVVQALLSAKLNDGFYKEDIYDGTLAPDFIDKIPKDPELDENYIYTPQPVGCNNTSVLCTSFTLIACLDNASDSNKDASLATECTQDPYNTPASYTLNSPQ